MRRWWWAALALVVLYGPRPDALVLLPAAFDEMVAESDVIVHGRVVDVRARTTGDRRSIDTIVTLAVVTSLKGRSGGTVVLRVPGGQVGRYRRVMIGAPDFANGDEVVVFLPGDGPALPVPFGLGQGVYRVVAGADRQRVVTPPVVAAAPGRVVVRRGDPARRPLPLDEFVRRVRVAAGEAR